MGPCVNACELRSLAISFRGQPPMRTERQSALESKDRTRTYRLVRLILRDVGPNDEEIFD